MRNMLFEVSRCHYRFDRIERNVRDAQNLSVKLSRDRGAHYKRLKKSTWKKYAFFFQRRKLAKTRKPGDAGNLPYIMYTTQVSLWPVMIYACLYHVKWCN